MGRKIHLPEYHVQLGLGTGWSPLQLAMTRWLTAVWRSVPIFLPWMYAALALLLLPLARRHRDLLALLLSGLGLELSLLPFAATADYRYSHWMVVCTCIAAIALISFAVLWRYKVSEPVLVITAGLVGLVVWPLLGRG